MQLLGDARLVIEDLLPLVGQLDTDAWLAQCDAWRKQFPLNYPQDDRLRAQHVLDRLNAVTEGRALITTDVGQHQMWAAQFCLTRANRMWLSSGGAGTMGFGFPAAIGAQFARPDVEVWAIVGDGGFQMTMSELATAADSQAAGQGADHQQPLPGHGPAVAGAVLRQPALAASTSKATRTSSSSRAAYGIKGFYIRKPDEVDAVLREAQAYNDGPCVVEAVVEKEDNVFPMIPAGAALRDMIIERPKYKLEKPTGST